MAVSPEMDPDLKRRLADFADRREQPVSLIAEAAIASFLSPDADERKEAAILKRLSRIDRDLVRVKRDIEITSEALALFVQFWLVPLPDEIQADARVKGAQRYDQFVEALGRRLTQTQKQLHREVSEETG
ncbi:CopG family transcriptional regulator [Mesorhizobium australicum]|uniref:CopG family transcriptional regulator n=1 Tax=Mesorhizobium australicum TaxID=536018 RepID=UPI00333BCC81